MFQLDEDINISDDETMITRNIKYKQEASKILDETEKALFTLDE